MMKKLTFFLLCSLCSLLIHSQTALPEKTFLTLGDSTNSLDVVFFKGKAGSMSVEGRNVTLFNSFIDRQTAPKTSAPQAGTIMWLINGREFITGNFYLGDSIGFIVFQKEGKEFVNRINTNGNTFFKNQQRN